MLADAKRVPAKAATRPAKGIEYSVPLSQSVCRLVLP